MQWIMALVGLWLVIAPFVLGYSTHTAPVWNEFIVGLVIVLLAGYLGFRERGGVPVSGGGSCHP